MNIRDEVVRWGQSCLVSYSDADLAELVTRGDPTDTACWILAQGKMVHSMRDDIGTRCVVTKHPKLGLCAVFYSDGFMRAWTIGSISDAKAVLARGSAFNYA